MSLFAVGGANSAIPEMHRVAVDVHHWMTDKQFADVFAISQLSPGPNVLIVTLIGYQVAGVCGRAGRNAGDVRADRRRCLLCQPFAGAVEPCALAGNRAGGAGSAFDRSDERERPDSGADLQTRTWMASLVTAVAAVLAFATRLNPLWLLVGRGILGFRWRSLTKIARQA